MRSIRGSSGVGDLSRPASRHSQSRPSLVRFELVLRAGWFRAPFVYADPSTWSGFWYVTLGQQFHGWLTDPLGDWPQRIRRARRPDGGPLGPLAALIVVAFAVDGPAPAALCPPDGHDDGPDLLLQFRVSRRRDRPLLHRSRPDRMDVARPSRRGAGRPASPSDSRTPRQRRPRGAGRRRQCDASARPAGDSPRRFAVVAAALLASTVLVLQCPGP